MLRFSNYGIEGKPETAVFTEDLVKKVNVV